MAVWTKDMSFEVIVRTCDLKLEECVLYDIEKNGCENYSSSLLLH